MTWNWTALVDRCQGFIQGSGLGRGLAAVGELRGIEQASQQQVSGQSRCISDIFMSVLRIAVP